MAAAINDSQQSRAYQLEMFERSMKSNIIVCMATGSGKTNVAKLRIDAELERNPSKKVWFTAPNVVLAEQQHYFLSSQLPQYQMRTLLGHDNVHLWRTQTTWDCVLDGTNIIISTPQVLLDALRNAFVRLQDLSLLIVDEAHHCQGDAPSALIMRDHYHQLKNYQDLWNLPHVLGLTASIRISNKTASIAELESTLDATCCTPTLTIEDYSRHVHRARIVKVDFEPQSLPYSTLSKLLQSAVNATNFMDDPYYRHLKTAEDPRSKQKLAQAMEKRTTTAIKDLKQLLGNAEDLHDNLGPWASDCFVGSCVVNWHNEVLKRGTFIEGVNSDSARFVDDQLHWVRNAMKPSTPPIEIHITQKARRLIEFLVSEYHDGIAIIIFVERRSTAYALCQLLKSAPALEKYRIFSFVGLATSKTGSLIEVADLREQKRAFADFRAGTQDICIATSVAEEGIDIQAVNVVIRYDDPKQFVSFLQSRGRARQQDSKFVYFRNMSDDKSKYKQWEVFEHEMELEYQKDSREVQARLSTDDEDHNVRETYVVDSTGALLSYNNATQHLDHFCAVSSKGAQPLYLFSGEHGVSLEARVILPSAVPPELQEACSKRAWPGEKSAKRDAAFQAYKALHIAGLVSDNLVPFYLGPVNEAHAKHGTRLYEIQGEHPVWNLSSDGRLFTYLIRVKHLTEDYSILRMILPCYMKQGLRFSLSENSHRTLEVEVGYSGPYEPSNVTELKEGMKELFKAVFGDGSAASSLDESSRLPILLVPEEREMTTRSSKKRKLSHLLKERSDLIDKQPLLLWAGKNPRPYIWHPPHSEGSFTTHGPLISVTKVRKLQIYAGLRNSGDSEVVPAKHVFDLDECETKGTSTTHGASVLLLPTILHMMAATLRAQEAQQTVLRSIDLQSAEYLVPALLAGSASGTLNYERLEFLGDSYLKYRACLQMFYDMPLAMEGMLSQSVHDIVSNLNLETAARNVGLEPFITTEVPVQKHWRLPQLTGSERESILRKVHPKTLADVVESTLGAAFMDGSMTGQADHRCTRALQLFLPDIPWKEPVEIVSTLWSNIPDSQSGKVLLAPIAKMLDYTFRRSILLSEALTHSALVPGMRSLERLEFLGDAILDRIIKEKLFRLSSFGQGRMTILRHALASHAYLAYCSFTVTDSRSMHMVEVQGGRPRQVADQVHTVYLEDLIQSSSSQLREPIAVARSNFQRLQHDITAQLAQGVFPWTMLRALNAPKVCSDIVEALIAAVFIDSGGSLVECERLLEALGISSLLQQMVKDDSFESRTPSARLREICAQQGVSVAFRSAKAASNASYVWEVILNNPANGQSLNITGSEASCEDEARSIAAEVAVQVVLAGDHKDTLFMAEDVLVTEDSTTVGVDGLDPEANSSDVNEAMDTDRMTPV